MEILIVIAVIVALIFIFKGNGGEPNVENFTADQMNRHVKSLQSWIDRHSAIPNPSDSIKAELHRKRAQCDYALAVWKRKYDEASAQNEQNALLAKFVGVIESELVPVTDRTQQLVNEGKSEPEAIAIALKEWHESIKSQQK